MQKNRAATEVEMYTVKRGIGSNGLKLTITKWMFLTYTSV